MQRIVVIGASGSGKTTLARAIASRLQIPHIELDALHWGPNWTSTPANLLRPRVATAAAEAKWCACGNYLAVRDALWPRADTIIWLDYPLAVVFWRMVRRMLRRCCTREALWAGNRESAIVQLFTRDSIFLWMLASWRKHRSLYPALLAEQAQRGVQVKRFRAPADVERWCRCL